MINYKEILNSAQYEAVTAEDKRLLFLAGAGTGKTHTMIYRTAYLVENGVNPENILLLTFTNKAAHEMVERLEKLNIEGITACTFHSFCAAYLRRYGKEIGLDKKFTILTQSDTEEVIRMHHSKECPLPAKDIAVIESYAINKGISLDESTSFFTKDMTGLLASWVKEITLAAQNYRRSHNMISYDDILTEFIRLLKESGVGALLRSKYKHIMVDEYQDTNILQDEILDLIDPKYLAVVGDDCQSLYAFRGAEVENILNFPKKHNARVIKIEQNYRSNQNILDLSNTMMRDFTSEGIPKWLTATTNEGDAPVLHRPSNPEEESEYVLEYIKKWLKENDPSELCVLVRTARTSSFLEAKLTALKIPFDKRGGPKFFESEHIRDVLSLFELTRNQKNQIAWFRSLMLIRNIGAVTAKRISDECSYDKSLLFSKKNSKLSFYEDLLGFHKAVTDDSEWHERLHNLIDYYIDTKVKNINLSNSKYKEETKLAVKTTIMPDLKILEDIAKSFSSEDEFLDDLMTDNISEDKENDRLVISTIHSAKGLEFDFVILMGASEGIFPREYSDEELRCMYVAITRPKRFLLITSPVFYMSRRGPKKTKIPIWIRHAREI